MRIAYIATGAAGMVCGTCIHDNTLAAALIKLGHEVALIPTYTPLRTDEENVSLNRVFMGGLNIYLQEKFNFFRHTPAFIDNLLNSARLLNRLSKFSGSTKASELGEMTVSVLQGANGRQRKELLKLVEWLKNEYKPDIVQLNHSLILGFAAELKAQLGAPVVCGVQGEDLFLDDLVEPHKTAAFDLIKEKVNDVDAIIATSDYYSNYMAGYLSAKPAKMTTVHLGINTEDYVNQTRRPQQDEVIIGYLGRLCPEKGLRLLLQAFRQIRQKHGAKVRLQIAGYMSLKDKSFYESCRQNVQEWGISAAVDFLGEVNRAEKVDFLKRIDIFSAPTIYKESKGLSILEALANGVPVAQPRHGLFPEIIAKTGGGLLFEPESVNSLAKALNILIEDAPKRRQLGEAGRKAVLRDFTAEKMARATTAVYEKCLQSRNTAPNLVSKG